MTSLEQPRSQDAPAHYRIRIRGRFDQTWSDWFDHMALSLLYDRGDSVTTLYGVIKDQAALHGLLTRIRDLGLILLLVERVEESPTRVEPVSKPG